MLVHQFLEERAARAPEAPAIIESGRRVSYGELERLSNRFAHLYRNAGVQRRDRVVIALENSAEAVAAYMGAMKAGAVAVPLPAGRRSDRLARAIRDCSPIVCVVDQATAREAQPGHPFTSEQTVFVWHGSVPRPASGRFYDLRSELDAMPDNSVGVRAIDSDLAAIIYTSGSTGEPRGVMLTHLNLVANTQSIVEYLRLTADDRVMCVLPFYYVYGLSLLHTHLAVGGSIVIENGAFPNIVLASMVRERVTGFAGVPSTFTMMLHRSNLGETQFADLRYVTLAGGAMPTQRILEWVSRVPDAAFYVMYGATEAGARLTYLPAERLHDKLGSVGRPIPNVEIQVLRDDGTIARPGEVGEVVARGANISPGYWNSEEETLLAFGPFGYHTGDLGFVDDEGFLYLVGRRRDMIKVGAHRVGPKEIEDVLLDHPAVEDAAVVAAPHDLLGEAPVAFVVLRDSLPQAEASLKSFCAARLVGYKVPVHIQVETELPKIFGVGKIDRSALRSTAAALLGARHLNVAADAT